VRKVVLAGLIFIFTAAFPATAFSQSVQFSPLRSNSSGSDYQLTFKSEVEPYNPTPEFLEQFFEYWNKFYGRDIQSETNQDFYEYTYTFENLGHTKLKLNFSEWELMHSPFISIIQDFSFELDAGSAMRLSFVANGQPKTLISHENAGIWDDKNKVWVFAGIGLASFYIPPWNGLYKVTSYFKR